MFGVDTDVIESWLDFLTWFGAGVGIVSVLLNLLTIWVFSGMKPRKYPTYTLYICIGLADVVNGVNAVLTLLVYKTSCKQLLCNILGPLTMTVRMTLDYLTILSVGRLTAIAFPFHFRTVFSFRKTLLYVLVFFLFSFTQYVFVPATGGRFTPLDYGWCAPRINWSHDSAIFAYTISLDMLPLVLNSFLCIGCFIASMLLLRSSRSVVENRERDKSIKILRYMLASFVVCFSSWVVLELLGSLGGLGINAGIYIGPDANPSCSTKLLYKLMLTGVFSNGVFNALFLLRGSGKIRLRVFKQFFLSSSSSTQTTPLLQDQ